MRSRAATIGLALALASAAAPARAQNDQQSDTYNFPQTQDTTFGDGLGLIGRFYWYHYGQGVKGTRVSAKNVVNVTQFNFHLYITDSCVENPPPQIDMYVNDVFVHELQLPAHIQCNSRPGQG